MNMFTSRVCSAILIFDVNRWLPVYGTCIKGGLFVIDDNCEGKGGKQESEKEERAGEGFPRPST